MRRRGEHGTGKVREWLRHALQILWSLVNKVNEEYRYTFCQVSVTHAEHVTLRDTSGRQPTNRELPPASSTCRGRRAPSSAAAGGPSGTGSHRRHHHGQLVSRLPSASPGGNRRAADAIAERSRRRSGSDSRGCWSSEDGRRGGRADSRPASGWSCTRRRGDVVETGRPRRRGFPDIARSTALINQTIFS